MWLVKFIALVILSGLTLRGFLDDLTECNAKKLSIGKMTAYAFLRMILLAAVTLMIVDHA